MRNSKFWILFAAITFLANACGGGQAGDEIQPKPGTVTPSVTALPTTTPGATPKPSQTVTPTPAPVALGNPVPIPSDSITTDNAGHIVGLARWEGPFGSFGAAPLWDIAIAPNSTYLAAAAEDGLVSVWNVNTGNPVAFSASSQTHYKHHPANYHIEVGFTQGSENLVILDNQEEYQCPRQQNYTAQEFQCRTAEAERVGRVRRVEVRAPYVPFPSIVLRGAKDMLYFAEYNWLDTLILRQSTNFKEIARFKCAVREPSRFLISPDQSRVFMLWQEGNKPCSEQYYDQYSDAVGKYGNWVLSAWDFKGNLLTEKNLGVDAIANWIISPDGKWLAITTIRPYMDFPGDDEIGIDIIETETGAIVRRISLYLVEDEDTTEWSPMDVSVSLSSAMAFSPDSSLLAIGEEDLNPSGVRVWEEIKKTGGFSLVRVSDGQILATLTGHTDDVSDLEFSKDGLWLVSCSLDGTIRFWGIP